MCSEFPYEFIIQVDIMGHAMHRINQTFKKDFQSMKNLAEYEKLQKRIELQKGNQDIYIINGNI